MLQYLSSRRLTLGMGIGYVETEFEAVGVPMEECSSRHHEGIELIRRLFHEDEMTFPGDFYSVDSFRLERISDSHPESLRRQRRNY